MVHPKLSKEFWAEGPGAMYWWSEYELLVVFPRVGPVRLQMYRTETDWNEKGDILAWDGNKEKPTLYGSIHAMPPEGWHGFIKEGELVECI